MQRVAPSQISPTERAELEAVLKAKVLVRSPSVLRVAEYIVRQCLDGQADSLKEYNIAVGALGKPADFDPKMDSIVRVETHRLRKKLTEFYQTEGSARTLRVVLEPGQYVPKFVLTEPRPSGSALTVDFTTGPRPSGSVAARLNQPFAWRKRLLLAGVAVLAAGLLLAYLGLARNSANAPQGVWLISGVPARIVVVSAAGPVWRGDNWFSGGQATYGPPLALIPEAAHAGQRQGNFDYAIPISKAPYELRLYFGPRVSSTGRAGRIARGFDVLANGVKLLDALDPDVGPANPDRAIIRVFHDIGPAPDGKLHLAFRNGAEVAYVNAIELTPGQAHRLMPIRMIAKSAPYTEPSGRIWVADRYVTGGTLKIRTRPVPGRIDQNLVAGERYGTFAYDIPVSKGTYGLKLYFSESWFGQGLEGGGGIGSRRFDVYANRMPLLVNFDLLREAGLGTVVKVFHGLAPNADGYINLTFAPRVNHACINALELIDETR
jgi:hypothetical protein